MSAPRKLKVYRTPIGFHDAYVAAPSQKAALEAWGADANLFARGAAEAVTDPKLTKDPLSRPGQVIRVARGTAAEHIAALPKRTAKVKASPGKAATTARHAKKQRPPRPKPSRDKIDAAEHAMDEASARHAREASDLAEREAALSKERQALEAAQKKERERLQRQFDEAKKRYRAEMDKWEP